MEEGEEVGERLTASVVLLRGWGCVEKGGERIFVFVFVFIFFSLWFLQEDAYGESRIF